MVFGKYDAVTHPLVLAEADYNDILTTAHERSETFLVRVNGANFEAIKGGGTSGAGTLVYGGAGNNGGITGTDPTAVIQACLTNLTGGRTHVETVKLKGEFTLDTQIIVSAYTHLDLTEASIIIDGSFAIGGAKPGIIVNESNGDTNIIITGGIIDGNKAASTADNAATFSMGIMFRDVHTCVVKDVHIKDCKTFGIFFSRSGGVMVGNSSNFWFVNLHVEDCDWDNMATTSEYGHIISCDSHGSGRCGLTNEESRYISVIGGNYYDNGETGVECGVAPSAGLNYRVVGVNCFNNNYAGISYSHLSDSSIVGCTCNSNDNGAGNNDGIYLLGCDSVTISGCSIADNDGYGIKVATGSTNILLSADNSVHDNVTGNYYMNDGSDALTSNGTIQLVRHTDPLLTIQNQSDGGGAYTDWDFDDGTVPPPFNAKGAAIIIRANDAGSSGYNCNVLLRKNGETDVQQTLYGNCGYIDDGVADSFMLIEWDNAHKIEYSIFTGGVNTFDFQIILVGWTY